MWFIFVLWSSLIVHCFCFSRYTINDRIVIKSPIFAEKEVEVTCLSTKQTTKIPVGAPLSLAAARTGLRLSFQCKAGHCASCETMLNGQRVRTCLTKVPDKAKNTIIKAAN